MSRNKKIKLSDEVYWKIIEGLAGGKYSAGMAIKEQHLADELGISRTPIREALKQLEEQGIINDVPFKGKVIASLSYDEVKDIYLIREVLEGLAGRLATERMSKEDLEMLRDYNKQCAEATEKNLVVHYTMANENFHWLITARSENRQLIKMTGNIAKINNLLIRATTQFPGSMRRGVQEHEEIVAAMAKRDGEMVEQLIRGHVVRSREEYGRTCKPISPEVVKDMTNLYLQKFD